MSEVQTFLFEGLPVRGILVRLTDSWQELLQRRQASGPTHPQVQALLGQLSAAAVLLQSSIKFHGALVLQIFGDGPLKLAVAEVQSDLGFRATAKLVGELPAGDGSAWSLQDWVNVHGKGRCAITLDPQDRDGGQQPYQGVVPLVDAQSGQALTDLSAVLRQYMAHSEQLESSWVLAANDQMAAGLLIQRMPTQGERNLQSQSAADEDDAAEHFNRIAHLTSTLSAEELLGLDAATILHRLYWEEDVRVFEPKVGADGPHHHCTCSRERVAGMLKGLGQEEIDDILAEQGQVEIACDFCGQKYHFDAIDAAELFTPGAQVSPPNPNRTLQ